MRMILVLMACVLCVFPISAQALDQEAQAAKEEGMRLWGISEWIKMQPYLEKSAESGDVESMYYLGEANRLLDRGLSHDAMDWYLKTADHGDPYAMLRLHSGGACVAGDYCPEDAEGWREKALAITLPKAEAGDTDAMVALSTIYGALEDGDEGMEWLERAAEAGNPGAQYQLGNSIKGGYGWYFLESRRLEAAEEWLLKSAEQGYVPAMDRLNDLYVKNESFDKAWDWSVQGSLLGHKSLRLRVGWCYLNPSDYEGLADMDLCPVEKDPVKGWAMLSAMKKEIGDDTASDILNENKKLLSVDQKRKAEALAKEWLNKEPPLSKFPPRYGY